MKQDELGYPILCDFGSAVFDEELYQGAVQALPYRAPEVILGAAWDHKIDIWNFGVLVGLETSNLRPQTLMRCADLGTALCRADFRQYRRKWIDRVNDQVHWCSSEGFPRCLCTFSGLLR